MSAGASTMRVRLRCVISALVVVWLLVALACFFPYFFSGGEEEVVSQPSLVGAC